ARVRVGGVEEVHAGLERTLDVAARLRLAHDPLAATAGWIAEAHAAQSDRRHLEAGRTEFHEFHTVINGLTGGEVPRIDAFDVPSGEFCREQKVVHMGRTDGILDLSALLDATIRVATQSDQPVRAGRLTD